MGQQRRLVTVWLSALLAAALVATVSVPADADYETSPSSNDWGVDDGRVYDITRIGDRIYVAGDFSVADGPDGASPSQPNLAAFDASSGDFVGAFSPSINGAVNTIEPSSDGSMLYVGGDFSVVNGSSRSGIVALDPVTGNTVAAFEAEVNAGREVEDIEVLGDSVYLIGDFNTVNEVNNPRMAKVDAATGVTDVAFRPAPNRNVLDLAASPSGDRIYVVGFFNEIAGASRVHAVALDPITGALDPAFAPSSINAARAIDVTNDRVVVAHRIKNFVSVYDTNGILLSEYDGEGDFQDVEIVGRRALIGSHSITLGTLDSTKLHAINLDDGSVSTTLDSPVLGWPGVLAIYASGPDLWVGGTIYKIGDKRVRNLGRLETDPSQSGPSTPSGLFAASSPSGVDLTWSGATDDTGVAGYRVIRSGNQIAFVTGTSYFDVGAAAGVPYDYFVEAVDVDHNVSPRSNVAVVSAQGDVTAPSAPSALTMVNQTDTSIEISWTASVDNVGVDRYDVLRDGVLVSSPIGSVTSLIDAGLLPGTYSYQVQAFDAAGNGSALSSALVVDLTDLTPPTVPADLALTDATATTLTLGWAASADNIGIERYDLLSSGVVVGSVQPPLTSFTDTGLRPRISYNYQVRAVDFAGNQSALSPVTSGTTAGDTTAPTAPVVTAAAPTSNLVVVNWTPSIDDVGIVIYDVWRDDVLIGAVTETSFEDPTVAASVTYAYQVGARDAAGNAATSNPVMIEPGATDNVGPDLIVTSPVQGTTVATSAVALTGTATDNVGVASVSYAVRDVTAGSANEGLWLQPDLTTFGPFQLLPAEIVAAAPFVDWSAAVNLADGSYTLTTQALDLSGNADPAPPVVNFYVLSGAADTTAPIGAISTPIADEQLAGTTQFFSGTAIDNVAVADVMILIRNRDTGLFLQRDGSFGDYQRLFTTLDTPNGAATTWSAQYDLVPGNYFVRVLVFDTAGNLNEPKPRTIFAVS